MKSFLQRSVDNWNGLDKDMVQVKPVSTCKQKLDKSRHGDRAIQAMLLSHKSQLGTYNLGK